MAEQVKWYRRRKDQTYPPATMAFWERHTGVDQTFFGVERQEFPGRYANGYIVDPNGGKHFPSFVEEVPALETVGTAVPITPGAPIFTDGPAPYLPGVSLPDDNPKTRFGVAKPPLNLIPGPAKAHIAMALQDGQRKYGRANWREAPVTASTYLNAAERHLTAWTEGEECAKDSGVHHLAHAAACLIILLDAQECKALKDDRPTPSNFPELIERLTAPMVST